MVAFAAAAAESLGWLIVWRFGSESADRSDSVPALPPSCLQKDP